MPRNSAVRARTQTSNQLKALLVSGPAQLREQLRDQAIKSALRTLTRRYQFLTDEIADADRP